MMDLYNYDYRKILKKTANFLFESHPKMKKSGLLGNSLGQKKADKFKWKLISKNEERLLIGWSRKSSKNIENYIKLWQELESKISNSFSQLLNIFFELDSRIKSIYFIF